MFTHLSIFFFEGRKQHKIVIIFLGETVREHSIAGSGVFQKLFAVVAFFFPPCDACNGGRHGQAFAVLRSNLTNGRCNKKEGLAYVSGDIRCRVNGYLRYLEAALWPTKLI